MATVGGRYYAMDRDNRWERVERAYATLVDGAGERAQAPVAAIQASYAGDRSDEFMLPTAIGAYAGMADGDGLLMANFRADRVRQVLTAFVDPAFKEFERRRLIDCAARLGMSEYSAELNGFLATLMPSIEPRPVLGELVAAAGMTQLRIAETEKYAHVTFFLNGGREETFSRRRAHPGAVAEGRHLRPETGDVGVRGHRSPDRGRRIGGLRPHCRQLRKRRHGRSHGEARGGDRGDGHHRCLPRSFGSGGGGGGAGFC